MLEVLAAYGTKPGAGVEVEVHIRTVHFLPGKVLCGEHGVAVGGVVGEGYAGAQF